MRQRVERNDDAAAGQHAVIRHAEHDQQPEQPAALEGGAAHLAA